MSRRAPLASKEESGLVAARAEAEAALARLTELERAADADRMTETLAAFAAG